VHSQNDHSLTRYLSPLTKAWGSKFKRAREAKKDFQNVADQCRIFFKGSANFWESNAKGGCYSKFMDSKMRPSVRMTMSKAFELVALFGPMLYHTNPQRHVRPRRGIDPNPAFMPPPPQGMPPEQMQQMQQQQMQMLEQQIASKRQLDTSRAEMIEIVLNYMPTEQPYGGLYEQSRLAISEALVVGRGCLWTELYNPPGSQDTLVGSFFETTDRLLIDPGATKPDLSDAYWIAREVKQVPVWKLEKEWSLAPGTLKGKNESAEALSEMSDDDKLQMRRDGAGSDLITYYKVWSKTGIGFRFQSQNDTGLQNEYLKKLDEAVGDYAFLVIVPGVEYPLNMPPERLEGATTEDVQRAFAWPVEHWRDNAWPVQVLDFYSDHKSVWPIAPLRPAIGPIVFINLMMSLLAERGVEGTKTIIGVKKESFDEVVTAMEASGTRVIVPIDGVQKSLREAMDVWQAGPVNFDVWRIIDAVAHEVERMTGLTDFLQGMQQTQDRSAATSNAKQQNMQLRPDDMSKRVESWQSRVAVAERHAMHVHVKGSDLRMLLGDFGAWVWDNHIVPMPIDAVIRETDVTIEAGSVRKPNKAREAENMQNMSQVVLPMFQQVFAQTGDPRQLNAWVKRMAKSIDLEGDDLAIQPPPPPPQQQQQGPDPAMQAEQMRAQAEMQAAQMKMQMDREAHQMQMQQLSAKAQGDQMGLYVDQMKTKARMEEQQLSAEVGRQEMLLKLQQLEVESRTPKRSPQQSGAAV
jgi:hypothetical protein